LNSIRTETLKLTTKTGSTITARHSTSEKGPKWLFLYAPGAGSNLEDPFGGYAAQTLPTLGIDMVRFQFPYMEEGRRAPDRPDVLEGTWRAVIRRFRKEGVRLAVGGRSMGGRIASQVAVQDVLVDALILLAYPLHPPGKPERRRDRHLPDIQVPTLFCSGTRDAFATPSEIEEAASLLPTSSLYLLEGADHGFDVLKSTGRHRQEVWQEVVSEIEGWLLR